MIENTSTKKGQVNTMEIRNLKTYIEVCEKNSFTKAAQ